MTCDDSEREYVVRAVAPGFEVEDFDIQVSGPQLIIKAERKQEASADNSHQWMEGRLYRSLPLPGGVDTEGIQAEYRSGILLLRLPKAADSKVKRIARFGPLDPCRRLGGMFAYQASEGVRRHTPQDVCGRPLFRWSVVLPGRQSGIKCVVVGSGTSEKKSILRMRISETASDLDGRTAPHPN